MGAGPRKGKDNVGMSKKFVGDSRLVCVKKDKKKDEEKKDENNKTSEMGWTLRKVADNDKSHTKKDDKDDGKKDKQDKEKKKYQKSDADNYRDFRFGSPGKISCDTGYSRIRDDIVCQQGAAHLGQKFEISPLPKGGTPIGRSFKKSTCMTSAIPGKSKNNVGMSKNFGGSARLVCVKKDEKKDEKKKDQNGGKKDKPNKPDDEKDEKD